jgi:hypothetical protein
MRTQNVIAISFFCHGLLSEHQEDLASGFSAQIALE